MIAIFYRVTNMSDVDIWTDSLKEANKAFDDVVDLSRGGLSLIEYTADPVVAFISEMNKVGGWAKSHRTLRGLA